MSYQEVLNREFLETRWLILQLAAALDRLDRAGAPREGDARIEQLRKALNVLNDDEGERAERVQLIFSREYDPNWRG